ncbi:hypothetical protein Tco_1444373, partial [Tanacetum coccineum]
AGRTARDDDPPPSSRRRRKGSYSDDGSDSRDDDRGYAKTPMISKQQYTSLTVCNN